MENKITGNEPAMPCTTQEWSKADNDNVNVNNEGLTIRQHFAAMAMAAYIASGKHTEINNILIAGWSVKDADALIAELNK